MKDIEEIGRSIVHCAIKVHKTLGPGLLESVYQKCLTYELKKSCNFTAEAQRTQRRKIFPLPLRGRQEKRYLPFEVVD
jgi:GxxExxY protein